VAPQTTDWDGPAYDRVSTPQQEWAKKVLERLPLEGDETVLDAGCGSGRVTRMLLDRLRRGRVVGVDGSPSMIETARDSLGDEDRVSLIVSDLLELSPALLSREAGLSEVDDVFSNATFHWICDHQALFRALRSVMKPGGRLVAQCGGRGNVAEWVAAIRKVAARDPYAQHVGEFRPWNFYGPEETTERLEKAGFEQVHCELVEVEPVRPEDPRAFVRVVGLSAHRDRLPEELHEPFTDDVLGALEQPLQLTYVRLNMDAVATEGA
jgi:trans-aconitate 2-methyltransferase